MAEHSQTMKKLKESCNVYVEPGNNHCYLIYKTIGNERKSKIFSLMETVALHKKAYEAGITLHQYIKRDTKLKHGEILWCMLLHKGDFILHTDETVKDIDWNNHKALTNKLYIVKRISENDVCFIHHSTAKFKEWDKKNNQYTKEGKHYKKTTELSKYKQDPTTEPYKLVLRNQSINKLQAIQVQIDVLGRITPHPIY